MAAKKQLDDSRRERASANIKALGLSADPVVHGKRRCIICNKHWKDFKLNDVVPHSYLPNKFMFCPLIQHLNATKQRKQQYEPQKVTIAIVDLTTVV